MAKQTSKVRRVAFVYDRDIYAYTGARLAAGIIGFEQIGPELSANSVIKLPVMEAYIEDEWITGTIDILDIRFGNLWTNISRTLFSTLDIHYGDVLEVMVMNNGHKVYHQVMPFARSFAANPGGPAACLREFTEQFGSCRQPGIFC